MLHGVFQSGERLRFVARLLEGEKMAQLCREFDISRKNIFSKIHGPQVEVTDQFMELVGKAKARYVGA